MNQGMNPYQAPTAQALTQETDRDWKWLLFSFDGRATRGEYWKATLYMILAIIVIAVLIGLGVYGLERGGTMTSDSSPITLIVIGTAALAIGIPVFWASLAVGVKRWHDRNKSGLWVLIGFIPYIGSFWVLIECGCLRGTDGPNNYGPDPLA